MRTDPTAQASQSEAQGRGATFTALTTDNLRQLAMSFVAFHDSVNAAFVSPGSSVGTVDAEMTFLEQITRRHATGDANAGAGRLAPAVIIGAPTAGFTTIGPSFAGAVDPADFEPVSTPSSPNADTEADEDDGAITGADATHDVPAGDFVASHTSTAPPAVVDVTARELTTIEPFLASDGDRAGFEPLSPQSPDAGEDNGSSTGVSTFIMNPMNPHESFIIQGFRP